MFILRNVYLYLIMLFVHVYIACARRPVGLISAQHLICRTKWQVIKRFAKVKSNL